MSGGKQMRSIREMLHKSTYGAAPSMGARLLLYWFTMVLLLVAAILSILMATGVLSHPARQLAGTLDIAGFPDGRADGAGHGDVGEAGARAGRLPRLEGHFL